jgi:prepilin-type N-terminal cleavage/methylation domain-containing protein
MSRIRRARRGFTLAEMLSVMFVLALLMTLLVGVIGPLMRSESQSQAKLNTLLTPAQALYRIQRDLRQTYYLSTWSCTTGASATCSHPTTFGTSTAIAFPTAYANGTGQFQLQTLSNAGKANWQGVMVYWINSAGDLSWAFDDPSGFSTGSNSVSSGVAAQAVIDATTGVVSSEEIATSFGQLAVVVNANSPNIISLQIQAQSTVNDSTNETTYRSDVLTRNQ